MSVLSFVSFACCLTAQAGPSAPPCWDAAAARYRLHPLELMAHACVESSMRPEAVNRSHEAATGSIDLGLMQINSRHLETLSQYRITRESLSDPCTNVYVGAWILADLKSRLGDTWNATGAYNAACSRLKGEACRQARSAYAWKVYRAMRNLQTKGRC